MALSLLPAQALAAGYTQTKYPIVLLGVAPAGSLSNTVIVSITNGLATIINFLSPIWRPARTPH